MMRRPNLLAASAWTSPHPELAVIDTIIRAAHAEATKLAAQGNKVISAAARAVLKTDKDELERRRREISEALDRANERITALSRMRRQQKHLENDDVRE